MAYRTERTALALVLGFLASPGGAQAQSAAPELGVWINHTGKGAIETYLCGSNLCGKIVWLKEPNNDAGKPKRDANNPDPSKRNRPVCGVHTLANLKRASGGWSDGQAYNPEEGKTYDVSIRLADSDTLKVTGSVLFFSKTVVWKRAKGQLQRCDRPAAPPPAPAPTAAATPPPPAKPAPVAKPVATTPAAAAAAAASAAPPAPVAPPPPTKPAAVTAVTTPAEPAAAAPSAPVTTVAPKAATVTAAPPATAPAATPVAPAAKVAAPAPAKTQPAKPAPVTGAPKPAPQAKAVAPANKPVAAKTPAVSAQPAPALSATKPSGTGIPTATGYAGSSEPSAYKPRPKPRPQAVDAGSTLDPTPQASR